MNRRKFLSNAALVGTGLSVLPSSAYSNSTSTHDKAKTKPALLGGEKAHPGAFPSWPIIESEEYKALIDVLYNGKWGRLHGNISQSFEKDFAKLQGTKHGLAISSGSAALTTMLGALDIGPEDEVIMPVYTFVATYNMITLNYALPIFVDTDIESFQIDSTKINF